MGQTVIAVPAGTTPDVTPRALSSTVSEIPLSWGAANDGSGQYNTFDVKPMPVKLRIFSGTNDITDQTTSVVVGQKIDLYCALSFTNMTPTNYQWTVPGYAISNYVVTGNSGVVYSNFPTTLSNVVFYWVDGATNRVLTCSATVRDQKVEGQARFIVIRPTADWTAETNALVSVDSSYYYPSPALHFGFRPSSSKGMLFEFRNRQLNGYAGLTPLFKEVQLADSYTRYNYEGTNNGAVQVGKGLDTLFPAWIFDSSPGNDSDDPGAPTSGRSKVLFHASFTNYLMFDAFTGSSIPVPTRKITWSVAGTASNGPFGWQLLSSANGAEIQVNNTDTLEFPIWSNNATNVTITVTNSF